ncbi:hypothetical protein VKT23_003587 [Stygiomarasmius scandens]|uniref:Rho termination factor N-terminal domain-containing protein n=1 Tax=Marasmiellus scandens TaxID=2682957 RepID=A0ABR1JXP0_9AGAR
MSDASEPLSEQAEVRKKELTDDPSATDVKPYSVTCKKCGTTVKLSKKSLYDVHHWRKHKARCANEDSTDKSEGTGKAKAKSNWVVPDGVLTEAELNGLNVAQLKATCKEKRLSGYSKLTKPLLIRRLVEHYSAVSQPEKSTINSASLGHPSTELLTPPTSQSPHHDVVREKTTSRNLTTATAGVDELLHTKDRTPSQHTRHSVPSSLDKPPISSSAKRPLPPTSADSTDPASSYGPSRRENVSQSAHITMDIDQPPQRIQSSPADRAGPSGQQSSNPAATSSKGIKRPLPSGASKEPLLPSAKKLKAKDGFAVPSSKDSSPRTKIPLTSSFAKNSSTSGPSQFTQYPASRDLPMPFVSAHTQYDTSNIRGTFKVPLHPAASPVTATFHKPSATTAIKRFMPLAPKKPVPLPPIPSAVSKVPESTADSSTTIGDTDSGLNAHAVAPFYLDFPSTPSMGSFNRLTIPPPLSRSRYVTPFSIFLSQVREEDIKQCMLVSRMFRRAVHVSAGLRLTRDFAGKRLDEVISKFLPNTFNLWPYLHQRQAEVTSRREHYERSFLGKFFSRENPGIISSRLWTSPDDERQIVVALRFLLTRLFFSISIGYGDGFSWMESSVLDAQEVVKGEIWRIVVQQPPSRAFSRGSSQRSFYVLESTCEVVGHPPGSLTGDASSMSGPLRADWSAYIAKKTNSSVSESLPDPGLISQLSWTNHEEYELGMSKIWLKNIQREGQLGRLKREMAERYILACVVGNSISGKWMSSMEMAQDFAGMGSTMNAGPGNTLANKRMSRIHLFLPEIHLVESVHFTTAKGVPLHPALAIVQTPRREYFVLRDNGMQVGCEEEGVAEVWMDLIGCDRFGRVSKTNEGGKLNMGME